MDADKVSKNIKFKQLSQEEKEDYLLKTYQGVLDRINQEYISGTLDFMSRAERQLYQNYQYTENILNLVWKKCLEGTKPFSLFLDLTEKYFSRIIIGVRRHKKYLNGQYSSK